MYVHTIPQSKGRVLAAYSRYDVLNPGREYTLTLGLGVFFLAGSIKRV